MKPISVITVERQHQYYPGAWHKVQHLVAVMDDGTLWSAVVPDVGAQPEWERFAAGPWLL